MGFWVTVAIYAAVFVINRLTRPKTPDVYGDLAKKQKQPRAGDGVPLPLYYGVVKFEEPNVVWSSKPSKKSRRDRLDKWGANIMLTLGIPGGKVDDGGPNGSNPVASIALQEMYVNGLRVRFRTFRVGAEPTFEKPVLYSGDGGGQVSAKVPELEATDFSFHIRGSVFFDSGVNSTFHPVRGSAQFAQHGGDPTLLPAYRWQTRILLTNFEGDVADENRDGDIFADGFQWGVSYEFPKLEFVVANPCYIDHGPPGYTPWIHTGSLEASPASVLYDLLTNDWARLGLPTSKIDLDSFQAAAVTLDIEQNGYSRIISEPQDAADVIREILGQINGVMYEDPESRLLKLKLIRNDYTVGALPLFDDDNVAEVLQSNTSTWSETYNEARVLYVDRRKNFTQRPAVAQNLANIARQGGRVRSVTINYPGISTEAVAQAVAARELAMVSLPLATIKIRTNRDGYSLRPGDCFRFTWPDFGWVDVVFRVQHFDMGQPGDETITLDAVQDAFNISPAFAGNDGVPFAPLTLLPCERRVFTEAPRWLIDRASAQQFVNGASTQRALYLAARPQPESTLFSTSIEDDDETRGEMDLTGEAYPTVARTAGEISYINEPYDTTVGVLITDVTDVTVLRETSETSISRTGRGLFLVSSTAGMEFMAYEDFTDLGGGLYRLERVWRGLFDTPSISHPSNADVYFLYDAIGFNGARFVGRRMDLPLEISANGTFLPIVGGMPMPESTFGVETDRFESRERTNLPYPVVNLTGNGVKAPTLFDEGLDLKCYTRNRLQQLILRGDGTVNELMPEETALQISSRRTGPFVIDNSTFGLLGEELPVVTVPITTTKSGHGTIDVSAGTFSAIGPNWETPKITVTAPHWRNLLANSGFDHVLGYNLVAPWEIASNGARSSDGNSLGGSGWYLTPDPTIFLDLDVAQTVQIDGYHPGRMKAVLDFYEKAIGGSVDTDDFLTVDLLALNSSDAVVASASYGPANGTSSSVWTRRSIEIAILPTTTAKLKVRVRMTSFDEPPGPELAFTEPCLRVGQISSQLLTNTSFDVNLTGWTTAVGGFVVATTLPFIGTGYARGNTGTNNEIWQEVTIPAGFQFGTAVMYWAQFDGDLVSDADIGQVVIEARASAGGTILGTASSVGFEAVGSWSRQRLVLENIPAGATVLRVRLIANRVAAGVAGAGFDALDLRVHKNLELSNYTEIDYTTPSAQPAPRNAAEFAEAFSALPVPDYGIFNGEPGTVGALTIEPRMHWVEETSYASSKFVGFYDAETNTSAINCYEFRPGDDAIYAYDEQRYYGNFKSSESFTAVVFFRSRNFTAASGGIIGRSDGNDFGWELNVNSSGFVQAKLRGSLGEVTATRGLATNDAAPHMAVISYDAATQTVRVADETGATLASTAGIGEIGTDTLMPFRIGRANDIDNALDGQIARVYIWRRFIDPSNIIINMWRHGASPVAMTSSSRTGAVVVPSKTDAGGALLASYSGAQVPYAYTADLNPGSEWGLASNIAVTNLAPVSDFANTTSWPRDGGATVTTTDLSPLGFHDAARIVGNNGAGIRTSAITLGGGASVTVAWAAKATVTGTARLRLINSSGVSKGDHDYVVTTEWQVFYHTFTGWDASTATGHIYFYPSNTGVTSTMVLGGPVLVVQSAIQHVVLPYNSAITDSTITLPTTLPERFNHEGEVYVDGVSRNASPGVLRDIVIVDNGANNNDARHLRGSSSNIPQFLHYDSAAAVNTITPISPLTWSLPWTLRGRWNRASVIESGGAFSVLRVNTSLSIGRASTWTASATALNRTRLMPANAYLYRVVLMAREPNLGFTV